MATVGRERLRTLGMQQSSALRGRAADPHMQPFVHSLKAEALRGERFANEPALRGAIARYLRHHHHCRMPSAVG
jgi:hypothetical protein